MPRHTAEWLLLCITLLWAGTFAIVKGAVDTTSASAFVLLRFSIALAIGVIVWPRALRSLNTQLLRRGCVLGALFGSGFILQTVGLTFTTASSSAFITGTMVAFVPIVHRMVGGSPIKLNHVLSIVLVLLGLWVFTAPDTKGVNIGDVLTLLSAAVWAVYVAYIDRWTLDIADHPQQQNALVILQFAATVVISFIGVLLFDGEAIRISWTPALMWGLLYCGILASVVTTWVQTRFQRFTHPVRAGVIFAMEPIFAATIAFVALHEGWTLREGIGACILIVGVVGPDILMARNERFRKIT